MGGPVRPEVFVGRDRELAELEAARLEAVDGSPRLVLVSGAPGIGKSALLRAFIARSGALSMLRANGDEAERTLDFGLVDQLVGAGSVLDDRAASIDAFTIGSRLLGVLTSAVGPGGLAVVVDDIQWADVASLQALTFALRRLRGDRVITVLGCRQEAIDHLPASLGRMIADSGRRVALDGLDDDALVALTAALGGGRLSASAARRLHLHTEGNPLYAGALIHELDEGQLQRRPAVSLPAPRSFANLVTARLVRCSPDTRELVTAMAVLGFHCRIRDAADISGVADPLRCVDEAIDAQLLSIPAPGEEEARFVHWLVRAAVYFDLSPGRRSRLHILAAGVAGTEDAVLAHRVAASPGDDPELAAEAAEFGRQQAASGAWASAAEAFTAAGRLAPAPEDQQRWRLEAVECLIMLDDVAEAGAYVAEVERFGPGARRDYVLGHLAVFSGAADQASGLLSTAWDTCDRTNDKVLAARIAIDLAHLAVNRGRGEETVIWARRALDATGRHAVADATTALCLGLGALGRSDEALGVATIEAATQGDELGAKHLDALVGQGVSHLWTDQLALAQDDLIRAEIGLGQRGPLHLRVIALFYLADAEYRMGLWSEATAHSQMAVSLARDADLVWQFALVHAVAAFPLAAQGQWETAEDHVAGAQKAARQIGDGASLLWAAMAGARLAHARGDPTGILAALAPVDEEMIGFDGRDERESSRGSPCGRRL